MHRVSQHSGRPLFRSFFIAGYEASSHRLRNGKRLNLLRSTGHLDHASEDFTQARQTGIHTVRTGINWHEIEVQPYHYDFSALRDYVRTVRETGIQAIWDLCHYGYPDDVDIFSAAFVDRFAALAGSVARVMREELGDEVPFYCPVNETSFWAWAGGDAGYLNPFERQRSFELKKQLVRATIEAIHAIRSVSPDARFAIIDPVISIVPGHDEPHHVDDARGHHEAQYQSWDMLCGRLCPELGGSDAMLDIVGINYYSDNQWVHHGARLRPGEPAYRPFADLACDVWRRYQRPLFIAETGIEGDARPGWLRAMMDEVMKLLYSGVPVHGLCLYPVVDYPGWDDDRYCPSGIWSMPDVNGQRVPFMPLVEELRAQQQRLKQAAGTLPYSTAAVLPGRS